ncbi:MAG: type II toxin-antitoxin system Phd/YefM family antitoxin [Verrucomicrobiaceae bacterium]
MKQVGLYEAKSKLSALVSALIESGDPVSLTRHGHVVAEIRLPSVDTPSRGALSAENFFIAPDFDHPTKPLSPPSPPRVDPPGEPEEPRQ